MIASLPFVIVSTLLATSQAASLSGSTPDTPPPIATSLARTVQVSARTIVHLRTHIRFGTLIVLPSTEQIVHVWCADPDWWQVSVFGHRLQIKPAKPAASTNVTIVGSSGQHYMVVVTDISERTGMTSDLEVFLEPDASMTPAPAASSSWVPASELARAQAEAQVAHADAQATTERLLTSYPTSLRFRYRFERDKGPFWIEAVWDDGVRTYVRTRAPELPALYELRDGKPALLQFSVRAGDPRLGQTYVVPKIVDAGYLILGKKRSAFRREH